jgi:hypothetical protein
LRAADLLREAALWAAASVPGFVGGLAVAHALDGRQLWLRLALAAPAMLVANALGVALATAALGPREGGPAGPGKGVRGLDGRREPGARKGGGRAVAAKGLRGGGSDRRPFSCAVHRRERRQPVSDSPPPQKSNAWLIALIVAAVTAVPTVCACGGVTAVLLYRLGGEPDAEPPAAEEAAHPPPPPPPVPPPKLEPGPLAPDKPG